MEHKHDELPVCVTCGCSIKDGVNRVWHDVSNGQVATHMYYSACLQELRKRVEVLEGFPKLDVNE